MTEEKTSASGNILVIKLGALGDFIQALGAMRAIRLHHPDADIALLTTAPYAGLGLASGYCDRVITDSRPRRTDWRGWLALRGKLNRGGFSRVYDLQNSDRSNLYFRLFRPRPEWVGVARGASHRNVSPDRTGGHAFDGLRQTLALAGIENIRADDLSWMKDSGGPSVEAPYVLLVPGCAPSRPEKRWPAERYGVLARTLHGWGFTPVIVGTAADAEAAAIVRKACPHCVDLTGQTALADLAPLARGAAACIGNDTGPMHLIAQAGCPSLVLFSAASDPVRHRPLGPAVEIARAEDLSTLNVEEVVSRLTLRGFRQMGESVVFTDRPEH